jgi:hypothetical protein
MVNINIEDREKKRFIFLNMLYKVVNGTANFPVNMFALGVYLGLDNNYVMDIVRYLEGEGLVASKAFGGFIAGKVAITHKGIREVEDAYNKPSKPTSNFPPNIIYVIGDIVQGRKVVGDNFENITNSTIINKSLVQNALNKVKNENDEETEDALMKVANEIVKSKDPTAGVLFDRFTEELNKPQPDKERLKSYWRGIENALPTIRSISEVESKIIPLFTTR